MAHDKRQQATDEYPPEKLIYGKRAPVVQARAETFRLHIFKARDGSLKYQCFPDGGNQPLSWGDILNLWTERNIAFHREFKRALEAGYEDVFWECAPIRHAAQTFEFTIKDAGGSLRNRMPRSDADNFDGTSVASIRDLTSDAVLVAPKRIAGKHGDNAYGHLLDFVKFAPQDQQLDLWKEVANQVGNHLQNSKQPLWVSTDGSRVPWLQVRLDTVPKYYRHYEYQHFEAVKSADPRVEPAGPASKVADLPEKFVDRSHAQEHTMQQNAERFAFFWCFFRKMGVFEFGIMASTSAMQWAYVHGYKL